MQKLNLRDHKFMRARKFEQRGCSCDGQCVPRKGMMRSWVQLMMRMYLTYNVSYIYAERRDEGSRASYDRLFSFFFCIFKITWFRRLPVNNFYIKKMESWQLPFTLWETYAAGDLIMELLDLRKGAQMAVAEHLLNSIDSLEHGHISKCKIL